MYCTWRQGAIFMRMKGAPPRRSWIIQTVTELCLVTLHLGEAKLCFERRPEELIEI